VVGQNPVQIDTIMRKLYAETWWYGTTGGIAAFADIGIDIALWDLRARSRRERRRPARRARQGGAAAIASATRHRTTSARMAEEIAGGSRPG